MWVGGVRAIRSCYIIRTKKSRKGILKQLGRGFPEYSNWESLKQEKQHKRVTNSPQQEEQHKRVNKQPQQESRGSEAIEGGALGLFNCLSGASCLRR
jgi:predicted Fe-S protein YdhL (DUF1289 family)